MVRQAGGYKAILHFVKQARTRAMCPGQTTVICLNIIHILVAPLFPFKHSSNLLLCVWWSGSVFLPLS
jgi:hypothetical protein